MASNSQRGTGKRKRGRPLIRQRSIKSTGSPTPTGRRARKPLSNETNKERGSRREKVKERTPSPKLSSTGSPKVVRKDKTANIITVSEWKKFCSEALGSTEIKIETGRHCIFCFRKCNRTTQFGTKADKKSYQDVCTRFMRFVSEYINVSYGSKKGEGRTRRPGPKEMFDFTSCETCFSIVEAFCEAYSEFANMKLKLSWILLKMRKIMKCAEKVQTRQESFLKAFKDGPESRLETKKNLGDFRRNFCRENKRELASPRVCLLKNEDLDRIALAMSLKVKGDLGSHIRIQSIAPRKSNEAKVKDDYSNGMRESDLLLGDELSLSAKSAPPRDTNTLYPPTEELRVDHSPFSPRRISSRSSNNSVSLPFSPSDTCNENKPSNKTLETSASKRRRLVLRRALAIRGEQGVEVRKKLGLKYVEKEPETVDLPSDEDETAEGDRGELESWRSSSCSSSWSNDSFESPTPPLTINVRKLPLLSSPLDSTQQFKVHQKKGLSPQIDATPNQSTSPCAMTTSSSSIPPEATSQPQIAAQNPQVVDVIDLESDDEEKMSDNFTVPVPTDNMRNELVDGDGNYHQSDELLDDDQEMRTVITNAYEESLNDIHNAADKMEVGVQDDFRQEDFGLEDEGHPSAPGFDEASAFNDPPDINERNYEDIPNFSEPMDMPEAHDPMPGNFVETITTTYTSYTKVITTTCPATPTAQPFPEMEEEEGLDDTMRGIRPIFTSTPATRPLESCFQQPAFFRDESRDEDRNENIADSQFNSVHGDLIMGCNFDQPLFVESEVEVPDEPIVNEIDENYDGDEKSNSFNAASSSYQ